MPIPEGNVRAKATDNAEHPNSSLSKPKKATDTTPPGSPIVNTDLTGKATTRTPVDVSSDPNTRIELLDKDNHVIGSGTTGANGHVTHQRCLSLKIMYVLKRPIMNIQTVHSSTEKQLIQPAR